MKVGILGCRGIPNHYGGFEQFAEYLSQGLAERGMEVWVYNSHNHPYQEAMWKNVHLIHCYDPEYIIGTAGQFIYDLNCIIDSRKRNFDIIYQLGNTSSSLWYRLLPRKPYKVSNMDGLEWMRSKYSKPVRKFLKYAEKTAVKSNDLLISDSVAIQEYVLQTYNLSSEYIPYGAEIFCEPDVFETGISGLMPNNYFLVIARFQKDNYIEEIIQGVLMSKTDFPIIIIGDYKNKFGRTLVEKYDSSQVRFIGSVYNKDTLDQLRFFCRLYFHGHSSGGTNPSLLEAMAASALICAHDNPFNRAVLKGHGFLFKNAQQIAEIINNRFDQTTKSSWVEENLNKLRSTYNWEIIISSYYTLFSQLRKA